MAALAGDLEGDVGGRGGLDLERDGAEGVVLGEQVVGRLAKVLRAVSVSRRRRGARRATYLPGRGNGLGEERHCGCCA